MFQDYCMAHGNPVIAGSLYCCDECRDQDIDNSIYFESPVGSPLSVASEMEDHLLYECWFCQTHHEPNEACTGHNYAIGNNSGNYDLINESQPRNTILPNYALEMLGKGESEENTDNSIINSNELIQSNYRKWLVNMTPR
ncbi:DEHA2D11440p [Debaryomyces hansenii CBS767]|uniref:DEHA2D11440p n=1 Tax=Debaryomyces hansenii (strain ATCC 36239 / CBS 767 / BCRC 21394 / JCM 1990 / NBRC 0083 / IGC 2968) TaxID=284592 RepID=Q6BS56_DEBHA|nr:DEHA2D11440p [Debaryomyces hansenii CBS767]CAG87125.1 DEHA2D11440p [Debaryomyces hansenii CBS767]|eukprot:XP_458964.1 DEHA2D11440p [Debaryomyces hansenii CBS767]